MRKRGVIVQHLDSQRPRRHRGGFRRPDLNRSLAAEVKAAALKRPGEYRIAGPDHDLGGLRIVPRSLDRAEGAASVQETLRANRNGSFHAGLAGPCSLRSV